MANQVIVEGDQCQSKIAHQKNPFPFTSEQCQQLTSMLNSHAFQFGYNNTVHTTNFSINPNNLSGISCDPFQESKCLTRQYSIFFAVNPANKTAFDIETWVLDIRATCHIIHSITLFTKITSSVSTLVQLPKL